MLQNLTAIAIADCGCIGETQRNPHLFTFGMIQVDLGDHINHDPGGGKLRYQVQSAIIVATESPNYQVGAGFVKSNVWLLSVVTELLSLKS